MLLNDKPAAGMRRVLFLVESSPLAARRKQKKSERLKPDSMETPGSVAA